MSYTKIEQGLFLALQSSKLDESDFILLAVKLLEKKLSTNEDFPAFFQQIQNQYLEQNYPAAIESILKQCKNNEALLGPHVVEHLITTASQLKSNPKDNDSRRFYETLYAEHLESFLKEDFDCSVFDDLNQAYNEVRPEYTVNELTKINTFAEARQLILSFVMLNDNVELGLKSQSATYQKKDRSREELGQVFTTNPGIMKPNAPNFADNVIPIKKIDKIAIDEKKSNGYSKTNTQVPFVASLSGTTYSFVVVLQKYMENHSTDPELEKKVNNMVMLWTSAYIKDGYHSYKEVIDIFKEPHIQSIFAKANIKLNYAIIDDTKNEFHKAQEYIQATATKAMMHQELLQKAQERSERKEKLKQITNNCESLLGQLSQDPQSQVRYPEQIKSLQDLHQDWLAEKKTNQEFKRECTKICTVIKNSEQNPPFSFTDFLAKVKNFFNRLLTQGFNKNMFKEPPSIAMDIATKLNETVDQLPESPPKKGTQNFRNKIAQINDTEVKHFVSPIEEMQKKAEGQPPEICPNTTPEPEGTITKP